MNIGDSYYLESGTSIIEAGDDSLLTPIVTQYSNPHYVPTIVVMPFTETDIDDSNVNVHLDTTISFNASIGKWEFNVIRSIGKNSRVFPIAESQSFMWKIIAVRHIREVGTPVVVQSEARS